MSFIINDPALLALLSSGKPVELTDPTGRVLGTFTPNALPPAPAMSKEELDAWVRSTVSREEFLEGLRDIRENGGRDLGDVIKELQQMMDDHERK